MSTCPLCEKHFKDRRGLHGHFRFVHGIEYGSGRPAKRTALTEATKRVVERKKKESQLIEKIMNGEFELVPRSKTGLDSKVREQNKKPRVMFRGFGNNKEHRIRSDREKMDKYVKKLNVEKGGDNYVGEINAFW